MINLANNAKTNWFCVSLFILLKKNQHVYLDVIFPQYLTASHKIVNNFTDYTNDKEVISF